MALYSGSSPSPQYDTATQPLALSVDIITATRITIIPSHGSLLSPRLLQSNQPTAARYALRQGTAANWVALPFIAGHLSGPQGGVWWVGWGGGGGVGGGWGGGGGGGVGGGGGGFGGWGGEKRQRPDGRLRPAASSFPRYFEGRSLVLMSTVT